MGNTTVYSGAKRSFRGNNSVCFFQMISGRCVGDALKLSTSAVCAILKWVMLRYMASVYNLQLLTKNMQTCLDYLN